MTNAPQDVMPVVRDRPAMQEKTEGVSSCVNKRERKARVTSEMINAGLHELACRQDPMTPICDLSFDELAGAYIAMMRARFR